MIRMIDSSLINPSDIAVDDYDPMEEPWLRAMKDLNPGSPLDVKARDAAIAYFDGRPRSISACAERVGVKRDTALRRLRRAEECGWVKVYDAPANARENTLSRVVGREVFWAEGLPEWNGDTGNPVF